MLIIPDIHINSRYCTRTLIELSQKVALHQSESNIILLWDMVYMFAYDREALGWLLQLFYQWVLEWKNVYILAWNHDWIWQIFVYQQAVDTLTLLQWHDRIHFITKPELHVIEWKEIVFVPYMIHPELLSAYQQCNSIYDQLVSHTDWKVQISWLINNYISTLDSHKEYTVIHHYYRWNLNMPGLKATFDEKDCAIDSQWIYQRTNWHWISWHIHRVWSLPHVWCLWATWSTTPWEANALHAVWKRNPDQPDVSKVIKAYPLAIHDHYSIQLSEFNNNIEQISTILSEHIQSQTLANRKDSSHQLQIIDFAIDMQHSTLEIISTEQSVNIDQSIKDQFERVAISRQQQVEKVQLENINEQDLQQSSASRQDILIKYLMQKYPDSYDNYIQLMRKLSIVWFDGSSSNE